jgi:hypothetical protein
MFSFSAYQKPEKQLSSSFQLLVHLFKSKLFSFLEPLLFQLESKQKVKQTGPKVPLRSDVAAITCFSEKDQKSPRPSSPLLHPPSPPQE